LIQVKKGWRSGENLSEEKKVLLWRNPKSIPAVIGTATVNVRAECGL
jgi:hypothetical protein